MSAPDTEPLRPQAPRHCGRYQTLFSLRKQIAQKGADNPEKFDEIEGD
jgi:hypothetical protein